MSRRLALRRRVSAADRPATTTLPPPCHADGSRKIDQVLHTLSSRLAALQKRMAQVERRAKVSDACRNEIHDALQSLTDGGDSPHF